MKSAVLLAAMAAFTATGFAQQPVQERHHPGSPSLPHGPATPFDHSRAVHHFYLHDDGGTIDVSVKDPKDETNLHAVRMHLSKVANRFATGDFSMPRPAHAPAQPAQGHGAHTMFVTRSHVQQNPDAHPSDHAPSGPMSTVFIPGAATLSRLKSEIRFTYTETAAGARVEIVTSNEEAAKAVQEFLRFQITEHRTGDLDAIVRRTYQTRNP